MSESQSTVDTKLSQKVIISVVVAFALLGGSVFIISRYYKTIGNVGQQLFQQTIQQKSVKPDKLKQKYLADSGALMNKYFIEIDNNQVPSNMLALTDELKKSLLKLEVHPDLRDYHLELILSLDKIKSLLVKEDQIDQISQEISILKQKVKNLP